MGLALRIHKNWKAKGVDMLKCCPSYSGYSITDSGIAYTHRKRFGKGQGNGGGVVIDDEHSHELKQHVGHGGYLYVSISTGRGQRSIPIHLLLADAFIGKRLKGMQVRHLDGNRKNNSLINLAYGTPKDNGEDTARCGTLKGVHSGRAVINEDIVRLIRKRREQGAKIRDIASEFNCSHGIVDRVVNNDTWVHVI